MRLKSILAGLFFVLITGCSSSQRVGTDSEMLAYLSPKQGMAKLVTYYPHSFAFPVNPAQINLGGTACRLKSGTFAVYDVTPGKMTFTTALCNGTGVSVLDITIEPGKKYYVQVSPNDRSILGLISGYGTPVAKNPTTQKNANIQLKHAEGTAFLIDLIEEDTAIKQLRSLKEAAR